MSSFHHFSRDNITCFSSGMVHGMGSNFSSSNVNRPRSSKRFLTVPSSHTNPFYHRQEDDSPTRSTNSTRDMKTPERTDRERSSLKIIPAHIRKKLNSTRTNLLLLVNKELTENKKISKTKINSLNLIDAEKEFSAQNTQYVSIQENIFLSRCNMGEVSQLKMGDMLMSCDSNSPTEKSPMSKLSVLDRSNNNSSQHDDSNCNSPKRVKTSVAGKKLQFFRMSTLAKIPNLNGERRDSQNISIIENNEKNDNIIRRKESNIFNNLRSKKFSLNNATTIDANLEYINVDQGILKKNTLKRTQKGFKYLRSLARKFIKPITKRQSKLFTDLNFEGLKEILCIKENIEIETLNTHNTHNIFNNHSNINLNNHHSCYSQSSSTKNIQINNSSNFNSSLINPVLKRRNTQILAPTLFIIPNEEDEKDEKSSISSRSNSKQSSNISHSDNSEDSKSNSQNSRSNSLSSVSSIDPNEDKTFSINLKPIKNKTSSNKLDEFLDENFNLRAQNKRDVNSAIFNPRSSSKKLNNSFHHISNKDKEDFFIRLYQC